MWDGRIVPESTLTSHINAARKALSDNGQEQRLIRTVARKAFRFVGDVGQIEKPDSSFPARTAPPSSSKTPAEALPLPDKPSIAALPFVNLAETPSRSISRTGWSRTWSPGIVADQLAVRDRAQFELHVQGPSGRREAGGPRVGRALRPGRQRFARRPIACALPDSSLDAASGGHLWAQRYEGTLDDIFDLQDRISESVVGAIAPQLERAEIERAERKPTESLDAYDHFLRGMARFHSGTQDGLDNALSCFRKAIALDPEFASAYGMAAWCLFSRSLNGRMNHPEQEIAEGTRLARCAVDLGKSDAVALARGGHALAHFSRDLDTGI